ncbi:MAG: hypothetical protein ACRCZP_04765, partial [Phycicoccus sp.]
MEGLRFAVDADVAGRRPTEVDVTIGGRTLSRTLDRDGVIRLPAAEVRGLSITVTATTVQRSLTTSGARDMPVVVGDVQLLGEPWRALGVVDAAVLAPCGLGPTVQLGGATLRTTVSTTRGRVVGGAEAILRVCGGPVEVDAGTVRLQALSSGEFAIRSLLLDVPDRGSATAPPPVPVRPTAWGATERALDIGPAAAVDTLLVVRENSNPGWVATSSGRTLRPVEVDGWAQAWVVPAGSTGTVELRFAPQRTFVVTLVGGLVLAALLLVWSAASPVRRSAAALAEVDGRGVGGLAV